MPIQKIRVDVEGESVKRVTANLDHATEAISEALPAAFKVGDRIITENDGEPDDAPTRWSGRATVSLDIGSPMQPDSDLRDPGLRFIVGDYAWENSGTPEAKQTYGVYDRRKQSTSGHLILGGIKEQSVAQEIADALNLPPASLRALAYEGMMRSLGASR